MSTNNEIVSVHKKLAEKMFANLRTKGHLDPSDEKRFIEMKREEGREVVMHLMEMTNNLREKKRLKELYTQFFYRYNSRLMLLMILLTFDPSVEKSFDPEEIV